MGLFNFMKSAGAKLAGAVGIGDANAAEAVKAEVEKYDLGVSDVQVQIEGEKVMISGEACSAEALEKVILAAGNINGVAQVEANIQLAQAEEMPAEPQFYTVVSGDNLSKIAKKFYGNANRYPEIFEANKPMLSHPDKIYPGQNLRIPADQVKAA